MQVPTLFLDIVFAVGVVFAVGGTVFLCHRTIKSYRKQERLGEKLFYWIIAYALIAAFVYGICVAGTEHIRSRSSVYLGLHLLLRIEVGLVAQRIAEGTGIFCTVWAILSVWLAIHEAQMRHGTAADYEHILTYVTDLLRDMITRGQKFLGEHAGDKGTDKRAATVSQMTAVLYTPSNGNLSAHDFRTYRKYREALLEAASVPYLSFELICFTDTDIKKYYETYKAKWASGADKTAKEKLITLACREAICLLEELRFCASRNQSFKLTQIDDLRPKTADHLIVAPHVAWIWIPHNVPYDPNANACAIDPVPAPGEDDTADTYHERVSKPALAALEEASTTPIDGADCVAIRVREEGLLRKFREWIQRLKNP